MLTKRIIPCLDVRNGRVVKGKKFKEFDKDNVLNVTSLRDKGILGKLIETEFYKYPNNSNAKADFDNLGVELKVTAFKRNKTRKRWKGLFCKREINFKYD